MKIVLLGDSIIDNKAYVGDDPSVIEHLATLIKRKGAIKLLARDGSTTREVSQQLKQIPDDVTHLVLSVGGNDIIQVMDKLNKEVPNVASALLVVSEIHKAFKDSYIGLVKEIADYRCTLLAMTIYEDIPELPEHLKALIRIFNDTIRAEALRIGGIIVDLPLICVMPEDYSSLSPIEPSSIGGAKIAAAIAKAVHS